MINKHIAVKDFVSNFLTDNNLSFESVDFSPGFRAIVPNYGDYNIKQDVLGNVYKQYSFAFIAIERITDITMSYENCENMSIMDRFNNWILLQEKNKNYPNFGKNIIGYKWELVQNMGNIAQVSDDNLAKYMLFIKLNYIEEN